MGLGFDIGNILQQYGGGGSQQQLNGTPEDHFDHVAQNVPHEDLQYGLSQAFRSNQTPPFGNMVGQMFNQADTHQRTGMVNQLIGALGPSVLSSMLGGGGNRGMGGGLGGLAGGLGGGGLASILGGLMNQGGGGGQQQVQLTPDQVSQLSPQEVEELAHRAEQENPGIVDRMSGFYAQNPQLIKALGGAALAVALGHMAQRNR